MEFSVLMSVYNREKGDYLRTALNSVFNQTIAPNEVILVKDGPLTPELEIVISNFLSSHNNLKVIALQKNVGLGNALNIGLRECSFDLVARMDSDDICINNRFELQLNIFKNHPEISVVGGWIDEFYDNPNKIESSRKLPEFSTELQQFAKFKSPLNHPTVMFQKKDIMSVGGYQHFYLLEDYWLWVRLLNAGYKIYNIQKVIVLMRSGSSMAARRGGWKYAKSEINLQYKMLKSKFISPSIFIMNTFIRVSVRLMPNKLRTYIYKKILRS